MSLLTYTITNKIAFRKVLFHSLITDQKMKKMSKSLGNVIDPDQLIQTHGLTTLRLVVLESLSNLKYTYFKLDSSKVRKLVKKLYSLVNFLVNFKVLYKDANLFDPGYLIIL